MLDKRRAGRLAVHIRLAPREIRCQSGARYPLPVSFFIKEVFDVEGNFNSYQHPLLANLVEIQSIIMDNELKSPTVSFVIA